ncbi:putative transcription factor [Scheffersomyces xylosifermentans]|uniref:putative transcription factor n=1 Tax=Scheffersomyces xylosifermentans TaxID=1304137 RepID=UPI00315C6F77
MQTQSKNRLRLIIPASRDGAKVLKSCVRCRKHKTKCDAADTNPLPCTHCAKKSVNCTLEVITTQANRSTIDIVEKLAGEVEDLKVVLDKMLSRKNEMINLLIERGNQMRAIAEKELQEKQQKEQVAPPPYRKSRSVTPPVSDIQSCINSPEEYRVPATAPVDHEIAFNDGDSSQRFTIASNRMIDPLTISLSTARLLFSNYERNFNQFLPIFPDNFFQDIDLVSFQAENDLLFWCIINVSYLNNPVEQSASSYRVVTEHIKSLVVEKCWLQTPRSVYVISSLLILTTWPLPNNTSKITDNLCVKFISTMKSLSLQFGLHKLEFIDEFSHKTKMNISQEVNLNNMIRERIYKFININSNYWLINLGLSNNNYNGFTQDYIINKATNVDIFNKTNEGDQYINSLLKISMIQSKLNENMNDLIGSTSDSSLLLPNQLNISKLINFNMFEIIIDDLNKILVRDDNSVVLNNLIKISIEFTKLQLFVYSLSKSDITVDEYKQYINKILTSCLIIFSSQFEDNSLNFNQLPIHYKFPIKLALFFMIRVFKSPILSSLGDYKLVKEKFNQMYNNILMGGKNHSEWSFLNARLIKVIQKFNEVDNCYIISKMQRRNEKNQLVPSFFLINQMKSYLILSLNYELIWLVYENENKNSKTDRNITDINWDNFGIKGNKKEFVDYIKSNESIFY